ncbi:DUF4129 domain-containing protein [Georgenia alba]|uniref:DUF4129 domain-containing protein n=1 Tax=Georgenia alba TaxID=2233858 RepID=A0ABW2Q8D6_9MICO
MRRRGVAAAVLTALVLLVLVWSSSGRVAVLDPYADAEDRTPPELPTGLPTGDATATAPPPTVEGPGADVVVRWDLVAGAAGLLIAAVALLLAWRLWRWWRRRQVDTTLPDDEEVDADLLLRATGTDAQRRAAAGDPRNAIVACWVALEDAAEGAGLTRDPAETADEFTARVLAHWQVDAATIAELADLYRTARFSRQPVAEADRARAVAALERIHGAILGRASEVPA